MVLMMIMTVSAIFRHQRALMVQPAVTLIVRATQTFRAHLVPAVPTINGQLLVPIRQCRSVSLITSIQKRAMFARGLRVARASSSMNKHVPANRLRTVAATAVANRRVKIHTPVSAIVQQLVCPIGRVGRGNQINVRLAVSKPAHVLTITPVKFQLTSRQHSRPVVVRVQA